MKILIICGSLRKASINKALADNAAKHAPEGTTTEVVRAPEFPALNVDNEKDFPAEVAAFKERIAAADGVIFVTPEYNRSIPGNLKNTIDWTSRPSGQHPWGKKPVGVMGASSGPRGTIVAQYDLKRMMTYFGAHVLGQPEFYLDNSDYKIQEDSGELRDEKTLGYLKRYMEAFKAHVEKVSSAGAQKA